MKVMLTMLNGAADEFDELLKEILRPLNLKLHIISQKPVHSGLHEHIENLRSADCDLLVIHCESSFTAEAFAGVSADMLVYDYSDSESCSINFKKCFYPETLLIINADTAKLPGFVAGSKLRVLTYGFSQKCSLIPSCVGEGEGGKLLYSLQREFDNLNGKSIIAHEDSVSCTRNCDVYNLLACVFIKLALQ